ncbi:hypothetical protein GX408_03865 [bacterium]|nr:hypothetical protein [bacterium]
MNPLFSRAALLLCLLGILPYRGFSAQEWQKKYTAVETRAHFHQPPRWFAPHAFWFWDAPLNVDSAASMAQEMTRQGLNPGYAHPRHSGDLSSRYPSLPLEQWLSPLWFASFGAALQKAAEAGMTLGYCDEYWWPSGQAFDRVLKAHPELEAKSLQWSRMEVTGPMEVSLPPAAFYVAGKRDNQNRLLSETLMLIEQNANATWHAPAGRWTLYGYSTYHHPGADGGRVNYLDPKLMEVFIPIAHQPYADHFPDHLGKTIPGVFVDNEGDYGWKMAWSDYLPKRYQEIKGRDLRLWLPLLTEKDAEGLWVKARYDWFDVVSDIYEKHYIGRMSDWLAKKGMYCISNLWEESLMLQTRAVGDFMRMQRSVTMPGTDCLEMKSQQVHDFKETQSVCEFEDRPAMSELMGVAGWEQTPKQMKMTLNSVTAWGVTHTVPHGINLNRRLETIPYPADWFTENPYWRYLHLWTDFARRASFVNRQGRLVADILLFNPLESVWALSEGYFTGDTDHEWPDQVLHIDQTYSAAMEALSQAHLDFLIADAFYLNQATVQTKTRQKPVLRIGEHTFSVLVLPPLFILSRSCAEKIAAFGRAGGVIVLLGELPAASPEIGAYDPVIQEKMKNLRSSPTVINLAEEPNPCGRLTRAVSRTIEPDVIATSDEGPLLVAHRKIDGSHFYWIANQVDKTRYVRLSLRDASGGAEIWDCESGAITPAAGAREKNRSILQLKLEPLQAFWLAFDRRTKKISPASKPFTASTIPVTGPWQLSFPETDTVQVSSAITLISQEPHVADILPPAFNINQGMRRSIVGPTRVYDRWHATLLYIPDPESRWFFRYRFTLKDRVESALVNINADNRVHFWVNGIAVYPGAHADQLADADVHTIDMLLKKGENIIAVQVDNRLGHGYLVMQGTIQMANGECIDIQTDETWRQNRTAAVGWQELNFNDSAWPAAQKASKEIQQAGLSSLRHPQRAIAKNARLIWSIPVPPGATEVTMPGLSSSAQVWLDGQMVKVENNRLELPGEAKKLIIRLPGAGSGLSDAMKFICPNSTTRDLDSWQNMGLSRFTGFIDYQTEITLANKPVQAVLDLGRVLHMAEVWINGVKAGERLWPPFRFDCSKAFLPGNNRIKVRVGNLMVNAMGLQDDLGKLRLWGWRGIPPDSCFDAGLFGPVQLQLGEK